MGYDEALLLGISQASDWGILTTDARLTVTGWNRWLEVHSELKAADVVGRNLFDVYPDLAKRRIDRYFHQALEGQTVLLAQRFHQYLLPMRPTLAGSGLLKMRQSAR